MFEKSLVDLIRGLRNHKGSETEYIQSALKECRSEIRSQDMDVKATALLKLIYLEMFGHDMTWAAFNVLEVMSSAKHQQKRVGYLGAVQSFKPDTEVLMLAENLLKKDLTSPSIPTLSLPLATLPHIVTSSLALSILTDLLPRLSHSQPSVRKKTIVTLYRLALVYPETLRVAWPKIKERLLDEQESSSVTAATVNVVCELGWRRPQDFLALAPRLFDLLVSDKNNWMAIKIIKLFAVLTPLEPRLVKKLVRPLTKILQETSAMSLLYECISGIIQGGILDGADAGVDVEEVADLCISKLRGMIVLEGDPNLKYVALLAFNKIVVSHPSLVSKQQDVIMACLDDPDISIKMQALELASGMVHSDNIQLVVNRLMKQLANAPSPTSNGAENDPASEGDNTDLEQKLIPDKRGSEIAPLPDEYRYEIVNRILDMCSNNTYSNITDFEWFIDILIHLPRHLPPERDPDSPFSTYATEKPSLGSRIGGHLLDVAVRVKELRPETTRAAETLLLLSNRNILYATHGGGQNQILKATAWICGEYATYLKSPYEVLNSLVHETSRSLAPSTMSGFIQAIPKIIGEISTTADREWNVSRATTMKLLLARTTDLLEHLSTHPNLEVQERSVEFLELFKLVSEALSSQSNDAVEAPLLLTSAIPNLFSGMELNPVAAAAQRKVPIPDDLDLDATINPELSAVLQESQIADTEDTEDDIFDRFYNEREATIVNQTILEPQPTKTSFQVAEEDEPLSYQSAPESPRTIARRKAERMARNKDDPFYIPASGDSSGRSTPFHHILSKSNGTADDLDLDSIPIVDLQIDPAQTQASHRAQQPQHQPKKPIRKFVVAQDETLDSTSNNTGRLSASITPQRSRSPASGGAEPKRTRPSRNLLSVDSSNLGHFSLEDPTSSDAALDIERREAEEAEMAAALREVERKRLEMQREAERIQTHMAEGVDADGTVVKRKKKKKRPTDNTDQVLVGQSGQPDEGGEVVKKKKKKKKKVVVDQEATEPESSSLAVNDSTPVVNIIEE